MSDAYIGQIILFAGTFDIKNFAICDGRVMKIADNDALFSLLGTTYGGDGVTTFALPDLRGRVPIHQGAGPGLTPRQIGQKFGAETAVIDTNTMPTHTHVMVASGDAADSFTPSNTAVLATASTQMYTTEQPQPGVTMAPSALQNAGSGNGPSPAHENRMPYLALRYLISLAGGYPPRQ